VIEANWGFDMRSLQRLGTAALAATLCVAGPAAAATIKATGGQVLLNRGDGYKLVSGQAEAGSGASVVVNPGGSAQIVYSDGCVVDVKPATVATITPQSPCTTGTGSGPSTTTLVLGAVAVGGGVGAAVLLSQQKDRSASP
jgi:hypothetical protein